MKDPIPTREQFWEFFDRIFSSTNTWSYLIRRKPGLTADEFNAKWIEHTNLNRKFQNTSYGQSWKRVLQLARLRDEISASWMPHDWDGCNLITMRRQPAAGSAKSRMLMESVDATTADEERFMDNWGIYGCMIRDEEVFLDNAGGAVAAIQYVRRPRLADAETFRKEWWEAQKPIPQGASRHALNIVTYHFFNFRFDCISETWFKSLQELHRSLATERFTERGPKAENILMLVRVNSDKVIPD